MSRRFSCVSAGAVRVCAWNILISGVDQNVVHVLPCKRILQGTSIIIALGIERHSGWLTKAEGVGSSPGYFLNVGDTSGALAGN